MASLAHKELILNTRWINLLYLPTKNTKYKVKYKKWPYDD